MIEVEIMYLLSTKPKSISELISSLKKTFDLDVSEPSTVESVRLLEQEKLVTIFESLSEKKDSTIRMQPYFLTPLGTSTLAACIELLSEIALTMQLGLNPKVSKSYQ